MSYHVGLDEMRETELRAELARRENARAHNRCDYCGRIIGSTPACRFADRHAGKPAGLKLERRPV